MVEFDDLKCAFEWIEKNDNDRIFGYKILCNTDHCPMSWFIERQSVINSKMQWYKV